MASGIEVQPVQPEDKVYSWKKEPDGINSR